MEGPPTVTLRKTHSPGYKVLHGVILGPQKALVTGEKEIAIKALDEPVVQQEHAS